MHSFFLYWESRLSLFVHQLSGIFPLLEYFHNLWVPRQTNKTFRSHKSKINCHIFPHSVPFPQTNIIFLLKKDWGSWFDVVVHILHQSLIFSAIEFGDVKSKKYCRGSYLELCQICTNVDNLLLYLPQGEWAIQKWTDSLECQKDDESYEATEGLKSKWKLLHRQKIHVQSFFLLKYFHLFWLQFSWFCPSKILELIQILNQPKPLIVLTHSIYKRKVSKKTIQNLFLLIGGSSVDQFIFPQLTLDIII